MHYAWLIFIGCCFVNSASMAASLSIVGVYLMPVSQSLGVGPGDWMVWMTIGSIVSAIATSFWGQALQTKNINVVTSLAVILLASSLFFFSFGNSVQWFWGWSVIFGLGLPCIGTLTVPTLIGNWFGKKHRGKVLSLVQKIPTVRRLNRQLSASRVSSILSMMLSSGFPTGEALEMTAKVLTDKEAAQKVEGIRTSLENGTAFADAVAETGLFDTLHERMIRMGSATGHEDQVLDKLSSIYEEQVEDHITQLVSIIEPTLVALLALIIGGVLLTVMLPMAGILSSL